MAKKTAAPVQDKAATIESLAAQLMGSFKPTAPATTGSFQKKAASKATSNLMISMGLLAFPIKVYKATDTDTISFNQLHDACHNKLNQGKMHCNTCDVDVERENIVKGYEYEKGKFVTVTAEEIDACKAAADDQLEISEFVDASSVDPIYFESTSYIAPDKGAEMQFALLRAGMTAKNKVAIGHFAAKGREQTVVIRPYGRGLVLHYMFFDYEIRSFAGWDTLPNDSAINEKFMEVAGQLVDTMTEDFAPSTKQDSYLVNTRAMLDAKAAGNAAPVVVKATKADASVDLMAALNASLSKAKTSKKKVA
jgi:DNA end-binding protein Ku